jgi:hypothetical protein
MKPIILCKFVGIVAATTAVWLTIPLAPAAAADQPKSVEQWGIFEIELTGPTEGNPFTDVRLAADFTNGTKTVETAGFYDGDGIYRIRFMPDRVGEWRYTTRSDCWPLTGKTGAFAATPPSPGNHGPVRVHNTYHFTYTDGTPYWEIGTTCYNWTDAPDEWEEQTLKTLAASPFNKVRMLVFPQNVGHQGNHSPLPFPYEGTPPKQWDFTRFNPAFFRHLEMRVGQLRDLGIEADIILFHPYGRKWGLDSMDPAGDDRYLLYIVARLAAYRNIWWSLANEYDFLRTKTEADWDRFFQIVQQSDPYGHLRSIHNGTLIYNHTLPWVTHASIQNGSAVEEAGRAELYRDVYRKPIVYDEVKYEGNSSLRWGRLTAQEMVHRFWVGTVAGTYVGHGDYYTDPQDRWVSYGGVLRGQSPPRLAFLKKILETALAAGIDPIDKWQDPPGMGGQPGEFYLVYFGCGAPTSWTFQLYKEGITDGMQFKIDVIDTWNMTITPVEGVFVTKKKNRYYFVDEHNRAVTLPGKPYLALRINRVADTAGTVNHEPSTE